VSNTVNGVAEFTTAITLVCHPPATVRATVDAPRNPGNW
jgi:hypothetical protein